jgi:hypothetical protein
MPGSGGGGTNWRSKQPHHTMGELPCAGGGATGAGAALRSAARSSFEENLDELG